MLLSDASVLTHVHQVYLSSEYRQLAQASITTGSLNMNMHTHIPNIDISSINEF